MWKWSGGKCGRDNFKRNHNLKYKYMDEDNEGCGCCFLAFIALVTATCLKILF